MNLAEFPIALLSNRGAAGDDFTFRKERTLLLPNGRLLKQEWIVTGSPEYGLPQPCDEEVLLGLLKIAGDEQFRSSTVHFTRRALLGLIQWANDGRNHRRVALALKRLATTRITARNAFWDNRRKNYCTLLFGILDTAMFYEREAGTPSTQERALASNWVRFSEEFFASIQSGYIKGINMEFFTALNSPVAKRLFRYLDKKRFQKARYEIGLQLLAGVHVGLSPESCRYASSIKQKLEQAHRELCARGFLKSVEYQRARDGDWKVVYTFGKPEMVPEQPAAEPEPAPAADESAEKVYQSLVERQVTPKNARELVAAKPLEVIETQVEAFDYLLRLESGRPVQNPAGFLTKAIREGWTIAPPGFVSRREREARRQVRTEVASARSAEQADEQRRQDEVQRVRKKLPPETLTELQAEAIERVNRQFGGTFKFRDDSPVVMAFLSGLIRERYLQQVATP